MSMLSPLHKALIARLRADATLTTAAPGGVHNGTAPLNAARPYVVITAPTEEPGVEAFGRYGWDDTVQFDTWSAATVQSTSAVDAVLDRIEVLLRTPLPLDGHTTTLAKPDFRTVLVEADGARHGLSRMRFLGMES